MINCVRSLLPIENPSYRSAKSSARNMFDGISHIMKTCRPFSPRFSPFSASTSYTRPASSSERTNGIIITMLSKPICSRARLIARHSKANPSR